MNAEQNTTSGAEAPDQGEGHQPQLTQEIIMSGPKYDQGKNDAQNNKGAPDTNTWTHQEKNDYYTGRKDGQK